MENNIKTLAKELAIQEEKNIATTILQQLGGTGRISVMIGASCFTHGTKENGTYLQFHFKGNRKYNMIRITLNYMDTYDVEFIKMNKRTFDVKTIDAVNGVYCDMLKEIIEKQIGMYLSL